MRQLSPRYHALLEAAFAHKRIVYGLAAAGLVIAGMAYGAVGKTFMPTMDEGSVIVQLTKLPSISLDQSVQGDMAVVGDLDPIPRALQQFAEHAQVFRLIVDDEDGFMVGGTPAFGWGRRFAVRGDGRRHGRGTGRREFGGSEVHGARHRTREGLSVRNSRFPRRRGAGR